MRGASVDVLGVAGARVPATGMLAGGILVELPKAGSVPALPPVALAVGAAGPGAAVGDRFDPPSPAEQPAAIMSAIVAKRTRIAITIHRD